MKKTISYCLLLIAMLHANGLFAIYSLRVGDPRFSWTTQQGTIEEAVLSVKPQGVYWEYGLYLTFSARSTTYNASDSLEVVLKFELPQNAIIHDSWLWINDDIVKAQILDRWTASAIYEGIVKRRQDPSILTKTSATQYELRVFPMPGSQTRKVKISFLMPAVWGSNQVTAQLPTKILTTSKNPVLAMPLLVWPNADWNTPSVLNSSSIVFEPKTDPFGGDFLRSNIPSSLFNLSLQLAFNAPFKNGYYFRKLEAAPGGYYQLAVLPDHFASEPTKKKLAVLLDFESSAGTVTVQNLLETVRNNLKSGLSTADSFNLIFSNFSIQRASDKWLPASDSMIDAVFSALNNPLSSYSNLAPLIHNGINFIQENKSGGNIFLLSNAAQYPGSLAANGILNDLTALMNPLIPFHIVDYRTLTTPSTFIGGVSFVGNEYFFYTLSQVTAGSYQKARNGTSFELACANGLKGLIGAIQPYDFHTTVANGLCYGRFFVDQEPTVAYLNTPLVQVGKYSGDLPFKIELSGEINGHFFSKSLQIPESAAIEGDTLMREMWVGKYIQLLESEPNNNLVALQIISNSIAERVLSKYTAFLCLEDTSQICDDCIDETNFVSTGNPDSSALDIKAYPNPFKDLVRIELTNTDFGSSAKLATLEIYAVDGKLLRQFEQKLSGNKAVFSWDGKLDNGTAVKNGVYIAIAQVGSHRAILKLVRQE
jgi:Vault protein inter-alpha-trypsin domain